MPRYVYECSEHGRFERFVPLARHQPFELCACGHLCEQVITAPMMVVAQPECRYDSPIDGAPITSWAQRREDLARNNCQPYDPEMKTDYLNKIKEDELQLDKALGETTEELFEKLPTKQRGILASEVTEQGKTIDYTRATGGRHG